MLSTQDHIDKFHYYGEIAQTIQNKRAEEGFHPWDEVIAQVNGIVDYPLDEGAQLYIYKTTKIDLIYRESLDKMNIILVKK